MEALLPYELMVLVYQMDPEKREKFARVFHQLQMMSVFREVRTWWDHSFYQENWLDLVCMEVVDNTGRYEKMVDCIVMEKCRRYKILGNRPRLPFDEFDLLSGRAVLQNALDNAQMDELLEFMDTQAQVL